MLDPSPGSGQVAGCWEPGSGSGEVPLLSRLLALSLFRFLAFSPPPYCLLLPFADRSSAKSGLSDRSALTRESRSCRRSKYATNSRARAAFPVPGRTSWFTPRTKQRVRKSSALQRVVRRCNNLTRREGGISSGAASRRRARRTAARSRASPGRSALSELSPSDITGYLRRQRSSVGRNCTKQVRTSCTQPTPLSTAMSPTDARTAGSGEQSGRGARGPRGDSRPETYSPSQLHT